MKGMEVEIEQVLDKPTLVSRSHSDDIIRLFYEFFSKTSVGGKWLCVDVKYNKKIILYEVFSDVISQINYGKFDIP